MDAGEVEIRLLRADEVARLISLVRRCYGDSYIDPTQYDEASVRRSITEGLRHSIVGFDSAGRAIAHMSFSLRRLGDLTADAGMTLVDPDYRGRKLAMRCGIALGQRASEIGLVGAHDYPVTVHGATQRLAVDQGIYTGLMLDNVPADVSFRDMHEVQTPTRSASLIRYLPFAPAPEREVFVPPRYRELIEGIYSETGLVRRPVDEDRRTNCANCELITQVDERRSSTRIEVRRAGNDTAARIAEALTGDANRAEVVHLDLPLADAGTPHVAEESRALGFFYAGLLPEYRDGDILRMQRLRRPTGCLCPGIIRIASTSA